MTTIRTTPRLAALLLLLVLGLGGCNGSTVEPDAELLMYVGPERVECMAEGVRLCLLVRYHPDQQWQWFYDPIEGFTWEPGFLCTLRVRRRHVPDPPADGSSYEWHLLEMVSKAPA
jgi:hypothetical protein